ncbi:hypothetical protein SPRG_08970 [Saprolegnia parasitica CBS 223.65]|uniref:Cyclic nucleotide-binding domain-containing protein n=1 Tax=Saprolegnia parasitica (strain CBS 223.65) TaxID=695850 RepID=A0A067CGN8_SAPPC|nr:hypothetical protein SPRG_08970 [Saprolegnia parasitica CBS 223.65]KDO25671.1 hypothetical protein SPRG_08970 [Saprolegnia parasitica CBS 223.65]|eukprot:XP_012203701.1 hypothetical protein SPRG_08970 [Saprolegnia parasitica CBS 223.65]
MDCPTQGPTDDALSQDSLSLDGRGPAMSEIADDESDDAVESRADDDEKGESWASDPPEFAAALAISESRARLSVMLPTEPTSTLRAYISTSGTDPQTDRSGDHGQARRGTRLSRIFTAPASEARAPEPFTASTLQLLDVGAKLGPSSSRALIGSPSREQVQPTASRVDTRIAMPKLVKEDSRPVNVDAASNDDTTRHPFVLLPTAPVLVVWNSVQVGLLLYVCIVAPYFICFAAQPLDGYIAHYNITVDQLRATHAWIDTTDRCIDVFFGVDILLTLRLAFVDPRSGVVVRDPRDIARRYLRGWFLFDVLVTLPWDLFRIEPTAVASLVGVFRLAKLGKVLRLIKYGQILEFFEDRICLSRNAVVAFELLATIGLVAHYTACGFYLVARLNDDYLNTSWLATLGFLNEPPWNLYVISLYWSLTLMTTVGFGDIYPVSIYERSFAILAMGVSAAAYAYVIASMSSIVLLMNINETRYYERLNEVNAYMKARDLPALLQLRTRKYYRYFLQRKTVYNEARILHDLPSNLKHEVADHYAKVTIRNVVFFHDLPKGFTTEIAMRLKPTFCPPNSVVITMGEVANEMYIISKGMLHVTLPHKESQRDIGITYLYDGNHFGEMALLLTDQERKRTATVRAELYSELHGLEYEHLEAVLARYPIVLEKLMHMAVARMILLTNLQKSKVTSMILAMPKKGAAQKFQHIASQSKLRITKQLMRRFSLTSKV